MRANLVLRGLSLSHSYHILNCVSINCDNLMIFSSKYKTVIILSTHLILLSFVET